jgi:MerR family transcriptional regulator, light-induced transcriptional regulator
MNKLAQAGGQLGHFSIKAVAQATGLTVETLRAWERRYDVVHPNRDGSGRRTYSASDVARLRLLRSATELGHTISRLAELQDHDLAKLDVRPSARRAARTSSIARSMPPSIQIPMASRKC